MNNEYGTPNNDVNKPLRNSSFNVRYSIFFKNHVNLTTLEYRYNPIFLMPLYHITLYLFVPVVRIRVKLRTHFLT